MRELKRRNPQSNIVAVDYDPGASQVNQLNRIKLMIATAFENEGLKRSYRPASEHRTVVSGGTLDGQELAETGCGCGGSCGCGGESEETECACAGCGAERT